jgi:hypothetical protein
MGQILILCLSNLAQLVKPFDVLQLEPVHTQLKLVQDAPAIAAVDPNAPAPAIAVEATASQPTHSARPLVFTL